MNRPLWSFPGGIHPPMHKLRSTQTPISKAPLPKRLVLPLHQHIGAASKAIVAVGDKVLKGQKIAHAEGYVSVALHAPTSGTVVDIGRYGVPHPSGLSDLCIVIASDGEERWIEPSPKEAYLSMDPSHLRNLVREAGIVGLGGAGFPSFIKLNPGTKQAIELLIINGIECEPYITCDDMLMREQATEILAGIRIMIHALHARECVIAIEDNKPEAYAAMEAALRAESATLPTTSVVKVPTRYPQGSEKQLVYVLTGKEVPQSSLPLHIGVVVQNIATARAIYRAIELREPLISRIVTVTGNGVAHPGNFEVLNGTPINELLALCGFDPQKTNRLIMGGPMMGFALHSDQLPIVKTSNCILAVTEQELPNRAAVMPCIRCGACADACPVSLLPQQLYWFSRAKEFEKTQEYNLFDCIECGCCDYVCPSNIPLVHYYRYAKTEIWAREREKERADAARQRHEFRLERIERDKSERADRHKKKRSEVSETTAGETADESAKQAAIEAAMQRVAAKKEAKARAEEQDKLE